MATQNSINTNNPGVTFGINTTGSQITNIHTGSSGAMTLGNSSSAVINIDCGTAGINVGATANAHTSVFGSTNSTSATTIQSGSGALNVTSTNGALTINSGTGGLGISTDASATTISFGTGGAVKGITIGSTNSTSSTAIACGTGGASLGNSANNHTTTVGSTNGTCTTVVQSGSGGITLTGAVTSANAISITSGNMTLTSGNLVLPATSSTVGQITQSGQVVFHTTGGSNTNIFVGGSAGNLTLSGGGNACFGFGSGNVISSGGFNAFLGWSAGNTITTTSSNICINSPGVVGDANTMRLGSATGTSSLQLNKAFIHGIRGITTGNADAIAVLIDSAGQLGTVSSSIKFKENVHDLEHSHVLALRPVAFNYKQDGRPGIGLIAEEVEKVMPSLVAYDEKGECHSVKYHDLPVLLLLEIQKLRKELDELKKK